ncbi:MAG: pilus (MSHA type) biogenesis protein MshL [Thiobacillus sp.]|nr:pilus (MSHA type) biogenesis protein MshL [Thiobacillus sp.]
MKLKPTLVLACLVVSGCATPFGQSGKQAIDAALETPVAPPAATVAPPPAVQQAVMDAVRVAPPAAKPLPEPRFSLSVNNAKASEVFMGMVTGTPYSMLVHPDVAGTLTLNLKDVTVPEAMEAIRALYGYDYEVQGRRIIVPSPAAQTRIYQLNALAMQRKGMSDMRVVSGSVSLSGASAGGTTASGAASASKSLETSSVQTTTDSKFWEEVTASLKAIVGDNGSVVVSPQSGVIIVKAAPSSLHLVEKFLRTTELVAGRQVMLEAKILEVQLNDGYQSGVNWAKLTGPQFSQGAALGNFGLNKSVTGSVGDALGGNIPGALTPANGLFSLAFNDGDFAAVINLIKSQGSVHVLSSPRIATTNNQKAVLRVGTDDFFVTEMTGGTPGALGVAPTPPTVTVQPFFSGIALDVTPQIDDRNNITLHVRPSVSNVVENKKVINLGSQFGELTLPLASSSISETDSVVRLKDGQIVAIGGLMSQTFDDRKNRLPLLGEIPILGELFGNTSQSNRKRELVVLIKTTLIHEDEDWARDREATQRRFRDYALPEPRFRP